MIWVDSGYVICLTCGELFCPVEPQVKPYVCLSCRVSYA